tara:strand:+ start:1227 stop:1652 length:426 start_codon:yes stop_codon:yes gene_type:complete
VGRADRRAEVNISAVCTHVSKSHVQIDESCDEDVDARRTSGHGRHCRVAVVARAVAAAGIKAAVLVAKLAQAVTLEHVVQAWVDGATRTGARLVVITGRVIVARDTPMTTMHREAEDVVRRSRLATGHVTMLSTLGGSEIR